jgi:hypothetical protein
MEHVHPKATAKGAVSGHLREDSGSGSSSSGSQDSKPILVIWQLVPSFTRLYSFPANDAILEAHCGYIGSMDNTPKQEEALGSLRIMISKATEIDPTKPLSLESYSRLIICGELLE